MSNITLNIVAPDTPTPTPVDPVAPNTGLFTHGIGGPEATIITAVSTVLLLTIVAVVVAMLYKKHKKQGKATKLVSTVDACATVVKSKKRVSAGLAAVALLVSAGTFAGLLVNAGKSNTNAAEGEDGLTLDVSSEDLTIEVGDEPVFAVLPVELTVEEATQAGYTLTAFTDSTDLVSTTDESKTIPMITVEGELAALTDNTYGLALTEPEGKDGEVYTALSTDADAPTFITDKDHKATEAGDTATIYYGFYITPDVPYGTYTGSDIYYDVEENYITNLSFDGNDSDGGTAMEGMTLLAGDTITLPENTYTRTGYSFTGWNTVATPTTENPGKAYADEGEFTTSLTESEDITLYAQWKKNLPSMQNVSEWGSSLGVGDEITVVDSRDGTEYTVARLADNNIWMTQNLDLDIEADRTYTSADTDLANSTISTSWTPTVSTSTTSSWTGSTNAPSSYNPGNRYWNGEPNTSWSGTLDNMTTESGNPHYHIGNYYNWTAAVAMSNSSSYTSDGTDVNQSICPAGWRLPTYSGDKSYQNLVSAQGLSAGTSGNIQSAPTYFVYGGYWYGSSGSVGSVGGYWSSVVGSSGSAYRLSFGVDGGLNPQSSSGRSDGYSLRCVAR